jgi:UDP-N-acetylglucosamine 2-epimerase (non-hydrolysing)
MINVLSIIGTRPEAIKMAPVIKALSARSDAFRSTVCATAQHREMLDQVAGLFGIVPDYDLDLMRAGQSPTQVASRILSGMERVLAEDEPDWVLVQGDTTTVMAASVAAFYQGVRVGHVEAGLRTGDKWQPFPEEINRRIAGVVADLHFAPTEKARQNLLDENVAPETVLVTGNTVIDALRWVTSLSLTDAARRQVVDAGLGATLNGALDDRRWVLVTAHRRENHGEPLEDICLALKDIADRYRGAIRIVYPVHPNPAVMETVHRMLGGVDEILLTPPLEYMPLVHVMKKCHLVLTDSGGIQEEAPGLGKPVLVLRQTTERPEGVDAGTVRLVGTSREDIVRRTCELLDDDDTYRAMATAVNPYGDGHASGRIVDAILNYQPS